MTAQHFICLDVGGTEIKAAAIDRNGALLHPIRHFPANAKLAAPALLAHFSTVIQSIASQITPGWELRLAFPGPFDYEKGICLMQGLDKYDALYGVDLCQELASRLALSPSSVRFLNDADAFALGELGFGSAKDAKRVLFVCIGTGCGSAFSVNGQLVTAGIPGLPAEGRLYHLPFADGCIDDYLSRRGLLALTRTQLGVSLDGKALAQRALDGDSAAAQCYLDFGVLLRDGLSTVLTGFRPEILCLGGQIMGSSALFLQPLEETCRRLGTVICLTADTSLRTLQGLTCLR